MRGNVDHRLSNGGQTVLSIESTELSEQLSCTIEAFDRRRIEPPERGLLRRIDAEGGQQQHRLSQIHTLDLRCVVRWSRMGLGFRP